MKEMTIRMEFPENHNLQPPSAPQRELWILAPDRGDGKPGPAKVVSIIGARRVPSGARQWDVTVGYEAADS